MSATDQHVCLSWTDEWSLTATRTWRLTDTGVVVDTVAQNSSTMPRSIVIAEHLILGGDLLAPVLPSATGSGADSRLTITAPPGTSIGALDYAGRPSADPVAWPGIDEDRWPIVDRTTPARVAALVDVEPNILVVRGSHVEATVSWHGLPHALLWQELARSPEAPWNGEVVALGVEPTSAPHGVGTALPGGTIELLPGGSYSWRAELSILWDTKPNNAGAGLKS